MPLIAGAAYDNYVHVGYQPYKKGDPRDGTSPAWDSYSYSDVLNDMQLIRKHFTRIRTWTIQYSNTHIIPAAHATGITVAMGAWAFPTSTPPDYFDEAKSKAEIDAVIAQAKQYPGTVTAIICGNENLSDTPGPNGITQQNIELLMAYARSRLDAEGLKAIKVGTCQTAGVWAGHGDLAKAVGLDIIFANIYPFWHGGNPDNQAMVDYFAGQYDSVKNIAGGKPVVVGETGWATGGSDTWAGGSCKPGVTNAKSYFDRITQWLNKKGVEGYIFEMFDEPWKYSATQDQESHFGIFEGWNNDRQKYAIPTLAALPALEILPGTMTAGAGFGFKIALTRNIDAAFDYYIVADTPYGRYSLYLDGSVEKGISPLYTDVPRYLAPYEKTVTLGVAIPVSLAGREVTFYTAVIEAGKKPPVASLSEISSTTQYVVMMDAITRMVDP